MIDKNTLEQIKSAQKHAEKLNIPKYTGSAFDDFMKNQSSMLQKLDGLQKLSHSKELENLRKQLDFGQIKNQFPKISDNPEIQSATESYFSRMSNDEKPSKFESSHFLPLKNPVLDSIYDVKDILRQMVESMIDSNKKHKEEVEIFKNLLELNQLQFESNRKDSEYLRQTNKILVLIATLTLLATIVVPILLLWLR